MPFLRFPIATALRESLKNGYSAAAFRSDAAAGIVVALIALPLSMALSIAVGLPPQHGLYTAIVAGIVAALLGGSKYQVTGPTAAFVAILAPIVTQHGLNGLIWCQFMAGAVLIAFGVLRLGRFIRLVPYSVTTGFTAGIAVVIATLALNDFFGLHIAHLGEHYWDKVASLAGGLTGVSLSESAVGISTLTVMIFFPRFTKAVPAPVVGICAGTMIAILLDHIGMPVDTVASRFSYALEGGGRGAGIPPYLPEFHVPETVDLASLIVPAITVALLAALESLLSATVADNITETKYNPDAELVGVGFGNLLCGFFAGIPATGALARTAANIHAGAKTPLASVYHALILLIFMVALAPYISQIPMASLAALLIITAWRMAHIHLVIEIIEMRNYHETFLMALTFFLTVVFDMVVGVGVGLLLALIFHVREKRNARV